MFTWCDCNCDLVVLLQLPRKHIKWHKTNLLRHKESQFNCSVWTALDCNDLDAATKHITHWNMVTLCHILTENTLSNISGYLWFTNPIEDTIYYDFTLMSSTCVRAKRSPGRPNIKQYIHYDHTGNYRYHDRWDYDVVNVFVLCGLSIRVNNRVFS